MDIVAGFLEIGRKDDTREIVVQHPVLKADVYGKVHFVLLPRQARHLANLLVEYASYAEAEAAGVLAENILDQRINHPKQ